MKYDAAISNAWAEAGEAAKGENPAIRFLSDKYEVDIGKKSVLSVSCNIPARPYLVILILHYLKSVKKGLSLLKGEWISFREIPGGEGYYPAFRKRVIDTVLRKYKESPEALLDLVESFGARKAGLADISVIIEVFYGVPVLINFWKGDEDFGPDANVLFDKSIKDIFCAEDIVVMSELVAHSI